MSWGSRAKGNKYANKKTELAGRTFDSRAEAGLFSLLSLRERAGEISNLAHHPPTVYLTEARIGYRPDFRWIESKTGQIVYGEMKGFETDVWRIKKKLWIWFGPGPLVIWKPGGGGPVLVQEIHPKLGGQAEPCEDED